MSMARDAGTPPDAPATGDRSPGDKAPGDVQGDVGGTGGARRGGDRGWAALLIGVGLLWFAFQAGWLHWNVVWGITRLWPLLLVAVGVDLLTRGRYRLPIAIVTLLVAAALWRVGVPGGAWGIAVAEHPVDVTLGTASSARLTFAHGVGRFELGTLEAGDDGLVRGVVQLASTERFDLRVGGSDERATVELASRGGGGTNVASDDRLRWELDVTREIPLEVEIDTGVGASQLDLREAWLSDLQVDAGVGRVELTLPDRGGYQVDVSAGVGEIVVDVPASLPVRFEVDTGLGGVDVRGAWTRDGDVYETSDWDAAASADRVEISLDGGIGRVVVNRVQ